MKTKMNTPSKSPATVLGSEESFRLLVEGLKDYAIVMLDPVACRQLERGRSTLQGL